MPTSNIFLHLTDGNPVPALGNGDGSLVISEGVYQVYVDEVDTSNTYVGEALAGTSPATTGWRIKKVVTAGAITTVKFADASVVFVKTWNSRASYVY